MGFSPDMGYYNDEGQYVGPEETVYMNDVELLGGINDSVLVLKSNSPRGKERQINVMLSPATLKALSIVTSKFVDVYTEKFGNIPDLEFHTEDVSEDGRK
ncbi:hypothetical protein WL507_00650 [Staphylococcus saprophyticus]|uniref:hypothetical protein n=1 Tax=Staphylococcus saprophyticus TaxID=29385 RepID=UPI002DBAE094|nr:hypothetical protein [Staphylococcus saprophyticus]MEB7676937.1 hypothetical protein [Staphylococcus saprophyticus]